MPFELTRDYISNLKELIDQYDSKTVRELISSLHSADIAEIFNELTSEEARFLYMLLDGETRADVLIEMEEDARERFLKVLSGEEIAKQLITEMDSDDAADVIGELSEELQEEVLQHIKDVDQAGVIVDLLNYDEDTAGGLMAKELIKVNENWDIPTCIREMRKQAEDVDEVYFVYVVDNNNVLLGILSLKKLLLARRDARIKNLYKSDIISVRADTHREEVANIMNKYDLVVLPVVDSIGRLIGRITIDDVVDVIREEAERDYQLISGISEDVEPTDNIFMLTRARLPWLAIGLLGGILAALVLSSYEDELRIYPEMAFFIPLIAAMGGNVGVQSSAIIVQGLASKTLGIESTGRKLLKELYVAILNGLILSTIAFLYNLVRQESFSLTITVSTALLSVILFASFFGTFIPLLLRRFNIDPALATGPFITTMNDIIGLFIYLIIGRLFYGIF
ncbi:MAG: magnesium transporter [Bacteroides sp. SM23_62_1]|nr:MAG: magnesium transporter [Bacteroides sp. SM23_62_1]